MHIGTVNINHKTSSTKTIMNAVMELYDKIIDKKLLVRRINITANNIVGEHTVNLEKYEQIDIFDDYIKKEKQIQDEQKEKKLQKAMIDIKKKYGKNAIIKGMNLQEGATTRQRNSQIGGHKG